MVCGGIWAYYAWGSYLDLDAEGDLVGDRLDLLCDTDASQVHPCAGGVARMDEAARDGRHRGAGYGVVLLTFLGVSLLLRSSHSLLMGVPG